MRVETTVAVPKAAIRHREAHGRLITEARTRLVELGLASDDALAEEPVMVVSDGDHAAHWVNVTFRWEHD